MHGVEPTAIAAPHAAGALRLLSVAAQPEHGTSQRVQNITADEGGLQAIVALLAPLEEARRASIASVWTPIQSLAAKALASLCLRNIPNRKAAVEFGAVELLLQLLESELSSATQAAATTGTQRGQQLPANVCSALAAIGYDQGAAGRVGPRGSELITRLLDHRNQATVTTALRALVAVATSDDASRQALSENEGLRTRLQELVAPAQPATTRDAAFSLRTLIHEAKKPARFQPRIPQQTKRPKQ